MDTAGNVSWEWLTFVAAAFELIAIWQFGRKWVYAWFLAIGGNVCWVAYVLLAGASYGLLMVCPVALALNVRGYLKWRKDERGERMADSKSE